MNSLQSSRNSAASRDSRVVALSRVLVCAAFVLMVAAVANGQKNYPPELPGSTALTYKTVGDVDLKLWMYSPENHDANSDRRPAVLFFFGGGWKAGTPKQFESHCQYLAARGIVAATADYRVATRHGTMASDCVEDAKSAVRWLRKHADQFGIDTDRICAAGGSAGGHLACCTGVISAFDAKDEDLQVSSKPNAMALFNPAVLLAPLGGFELKGISEEKFADIASRTGVAPEAISPIHHVAQNIPSTIIFHGKADETVPFSTVEKYGQLVTAAGNRCDVHGFADAPHGFFNGGRGKTEAEKERFDLWHRRTMRKLDEFLQSLKWLDEESPDRIVDQEFVTLRGHYQNSFQRFAKLRKGHVAFLGGSITEMNGYRPRIAKWLQDRFPETEFVFTNAGISSTCSNTGAFRLQRDVLSKGPVDLLFVEFAVNDDQDASHSEAACIKGMEGIVQHTRQHNPQADIIMTHFVNPGMLETIDCGEEILSASQHETVARRHQVSSVFLSKAVAARMAAGTMTWKQFGGTHPGAVGNQLAADLATSILAEGWRGLDPEIVRPVDHQATDKPILSTSYSSGRLHSPQEVTSQNGWSFSEPDWKEIPGSKRKRFLGVPMLHSETPGATAEFNFTGDAVGAYVVAGPDAGQLEFRINEGDWQSRELYHRFSEGLHYPRTVMFASELPNDQHRLHIRVSERGGAGSGGNAVRIIAFTVNGASSTE